MGVISELAAQWRSCGIAPGDLVLIHSNISRTLKDCRRAGVDASPSAVLASFLEAVGPRGTAVFPLFNFDFCHGAAFDIRSTPSQMGALTEAARQYPGATRTGHPVYSFAVIGARAAEFEGLDNKSAYADDSVFGALRRRGGKIAVLDLDDQHSMTFYHHVEEVKGVAYRMFKDFTGQYTAADGSTSTRTYQLYVRDIDKGVLTDVNPAGELMWEKGLYRGSRPKVGPGLRTVEAAGMFEFVASLIDQGRALGTLYSVQAEATEEPSLAD